MTLTYGEKEQVKFSHEAEKYQFIGYLTNHNVNIQWEDNDLQGAWGKEGRMAFTSEDVKKHFPTLGYSAGVGSYTSRLNCNDFVKVLFDLGFARGKAQDSALIKGNIPDQYQADFDAGTSL